MLYLHITFDIFKYQRSKEKADWMSNCLTHPDGNKNIWKLRHCKCACDCPLFWYTFSPT